MNVHHGGALSYLSVVAEDVVRTGWPLRNRHYFALDALLLLGGTFVAFAIRFEGAAGTGQYLLGAAAYIVATIPVRLGVLWLAGIYRRLWRYGTMTDLTRLVSAGGLAAFANICLGAILLPAMGLMAGRVPLAVLFLDGAMTIGLPALLRLTERGVERRRAGRERGQLGNRGTEVLIAGAGAAGLMTAVELASNPRLGLRPVGFLDDDPDKHNELLAGIRVMGPLASLEEAVRKAGASELIVAMPTAPGCTIRALTMEAKRIGLPMRTGPVCTNGLGTARRVSAAQGAD